LLEQEEECYLSAQNPQEFTYGFIIIYFTRSTEGNGLITSLMETKITLELFLISLEINYKLLLMDQRLRTNYLSFSD